MLLHRNILYFNDCVGLTKPDRFLHADPPPYAPNTQDQTVDYNGVTWKGQPGGGWTPQTSTGGGALPGQAPNSVDLVKNAQALLDFQKTANAPVAAAVGSQIPGVQDKYTQLVNSIKGNQQLDTNRQTLTTANTLGGRGLTSDSGVYQQEMTNALTPIDTQYAGLVANANAGSIQDIQGLALQQAQLLAGNPDTAISGGLQFGGLQNQASQIASQNQLNAAQAGFYGNQGNYYTQLAKTLTGGNIPAAEQLRKQFGL